MKLKLHRFRLARGSPAAPAGAAGAGFTLTELIFTMAGMSLLVGTVLSTFIVVARSQRDLAIRLEANKECNLAISRMIYGMEGRRGLRTASEVNISGTDKNWQLEYRTTTEVGTTNAPITYTYKWSEADRRLTLDPGGLVAGKNIDFMSKPVHSDGVVTISGAARTTGNLTVPNVSQVSLRNR